jgi:hypothetical protein
MTNPSSNKGANGPSLSDAAGFWERGRIWYNFVLCATVLLWVVKTWPHFRPALTLEALGKMLVLALLANLCYCAGYVAELFMQPVLPRPSWRRVRRVVWVVGMLLALVMENYWIADEIYPDVTPGVTAVAGGTAALRITTASNMNFPAPLAVLGFLAACGGLFFAVAALLVFWFARKPKFARGAGIALATGTVIYFALLFGFSASSHERALARGQEKYFCEIDCHLAYSIVDVKTKAEGESNDYVVTLRTRFDETTASPSRPKDAPLTPSPREARVMDSRGREYAAISSQGTSLMTPLKPAESYVTQLRFRIPKDAGGLRLLLNTAPGWPDRLVIGDENSWGHKKTYFAL